jgi:hypothetical protein
MMKQRSRKELFFTLVIGSVIPLASLLLLIRNDHNSLSMHDYDDQVNAAGGSEVNITFVPLLWNATSDFPEFLIKPETNSPVPIYMISSHLDLRPLMVQRSPFVQVIAAVLADDQYNSKWWKLKENLNCIISEKYQGSLKVLDVVAVSAINAVFNFGGQYVTTLHACPFDGNLLLNEVYKNGDGFFVSLAPSPKLFGSTSSSATVEIRWIPLSKSTKEMETKLADTDTAICVPPIRGDLYASSIKTWIETHRLVGFRHFMFYWRHKDPFTYRIAKYYMRKGHADLYNFMDPTHPEWDGCGDCVVSRQLFHHSLKRYELIPQENNFRHYSHLSDNEFSIHYYGQDASIHDCAIRAAFRFKWVAFLDLDEYIYLPVEDSFSGIQTWPNYFSKRKESNFGLLNGFFCVTCNDFASLDTFKTLWETFSARKNYANCLYDIRSDRDQKADPRVLPYIFYTSSRQRHFYPETDRTKFIIHPNLYYLMSIHKPNMTIITRFDDYPISKEMKNDYKIPGSEYLVVSNDYQYEELAINFVKPVEANIAHYRFTKDISMNYNQMLRSGYKTTNFSQWSQLYNRCNRCTHFKELRQDSTFRDRYALEVSKRLITNCD